MKLVIPDYHKFDHKRVKEVFEGYPEYVSTFCIKNTPVAVYYCEKPNRNKNHKNYMLLYTENNYIMVSGMDIGEILKFAVQKGIHCKGCDEVIYSLHRHDFRECSCGESWVDGGREYLRTNTVNSVVTIDHLTGGIT